MSQNPSPEPGPAKKETVLNRLLKWLAKGARKATAERGDCRT